MLKLRVPNQTATPSMSETKNNGRVTLITIFLPGKSSYTNSSFHLIMVEKEE